LVKSDEQAKAKAVTELTDRDPDFLLLQFTSVLNAGVSSSFSYDSKEYKAAVNQVDSYIGEIVSAVEARKSYSREEWLIVVTSNHGCIDDSYGGSSFQERNTVAIYSHKNFKSQELVADVFVAPRFFGYDQNNPNTENAMRARNTVVPAEEVQY